jgi:hypothetical protein
MPLVGPLDLYSLAARDESRHTFTTEVFTVRYIEARSGLVRLMETDDRVTQAEILESLEDEVWANEGLDGGFQIRRYRRADLRTAPVGRPPTGIRSVGKAEAELEERTG